MRRKIVFPPVSTASSEGLVAVGGDLEVDTLIEAYRRGIFPWPISTYPDNAHLPNTWFSPDPRGILEIEEIHVPRSFVKFLKKTPFHVTFNEAFRDVIVNCSKAKRKDQPGTWITPDIIEAYDELFQAGHAYSVEVWRGEELVGGLYGVTLGSFISGESMFSLEDNSGKQGFYTLLMHLSSRGIKWIDTQMVTEVVRQFGGKYVSRPRFMGLLSKIDWSVKRGQLF